MFESLSTFDKIFFALVVTVPIPGDLFLDQLHYFGYINLLHG